MENKQFVKGKTEQPRLCALEKGMLFTVCQDAIDELGFHLIYLGAIKPVYITEQKFRRFKHIPFFKVKRKAVCFEVTNPEKIGELNG